MNEEAPKGKSVCVDEALGGNLVVAVKNAFELLIEALARQRAQAMEDAPDGHPRIGMRIRPIGGRHQDTTVPVTRLAYVGGVVMDVTQNEMTSDGNTRRREGAVSLSVALAAVSSAARGIQRAATVVTRWSFQP